MRAAVAERVGRGVDDRPSAAAARRARARSRRAACAGSRLLGARLSARPPRRSRRRADALGARPPRAKRSSSALVRCSSQPSSRASTSADARAPASPAVGAPARARRAGRGGCAAAARRRSLRACSWRAASTTSASRSGRPGDDRLGELAALGRQREHLVRGVAVARRERRVGRPRARPPRAAAPPRVDRLPERDLVRAAGRVAGVALDEPVDRHLRHPPPGRQLAAGDRDHPARRSRTARPCARCRPTSSGRRSRSAAARRRRRRSDRPAPSVGAEERR